MFRITQGYSVGYLTGPVSQGREGYYTGAVAAGEPPGLWYGAGADALGLRGEVDADLLEGIYARLLDPRDPATHDRATWDDAAALAPGHKNFKDADTIYRELIAQEAGAGPERRAELRAQAERSARQAVAFEDGTFSAQKSVSLLGAGFERMANDARKAGDTRAAEQWDARARAVEDGVMAGARASVDVLQDLGGYARRGHHGGGSGRWIDAHEFIVAQFLQHDSRDRDPQLHVHQAILNRVQGADGEWTGLHGRSLRNYRQAAAAVGERVMEAHLTRSLGVRFETRPDGKAREVVGVSQDVMDLFSQRRRAVTGKTAELVKAYTDRFGREPSIVELKNIQQEAALATRKGKSHDGETLEQRLDRWERRSHEAVAGGLAEVAHAALEQGRRGAGQADDVSPDFVIKQALHAVGKHRSTWTRSDLMFAVSQELPANLGIAPEKVRPLLEKLTDEAMARAVVAKPPERAEGLPKELLLANGRPVYEAPGGARYATPGGVAYERILREAAVERGAAAMSTADANAAIARFAENGRELGVDQRAAVRGVSTSGARVEALVSAAGAGKSFTVGSLADVWRSTGREVYGLAPGQAQADILTGEGLQSWNTTAWLGGRDVPALRRGDIVVVDEAGMASTADLAAIAERTRAADAKLLLVGDHRQLAAVGAGGAFADLQGRAVTYELTEVRRFRNDWEGPASLRLRDGDPAVLAEYDKHGRIRGAGTQEQAAAAASRAWLADTLAGKESLLLVGSNEDAAKASAELRAELVRLGRVQADGVHLGMDQNTAGVGDMVYGRHNAWDLRGWEGNSRAPVNRGSYRVVGLREDGGLSVEPAKGGPTLQLPAAYVEKHLTLAYASTVHAAEGRTVNTSHGVITPSTDAKSAYVMLSRGEDGNWAWVVTQPTPSDAPVGEAQNVEPRAARAVFGEVLERAEEQRGALAEQEKAAEDAASTVTNVDRLIYGLARVNAGRTSATLDRLAATEVITPEQRQELAADQAMGSVDRLLRHAEVAGRDPDEVLHTVLDGNSLNGANFPARVLHARIRDEVGEVAPRITSYADLIPEGLDDVWNKELTGLAEASDDRRRELGSRTAGAVLKEEQSATWALDTLGPVPEDPIGRAEWEHRAGWAAAYRENARYEDEEKPLGVAPPAGLPEKHAVWWTAHDALGLPDVGPAEEQMSDGKLLARWAAWEREQAWAPRYVDDEMAATSETAAARRVDAELWSARAETLDDPVEAQQLRDAAAEARGEAGALDLRAGELEVVAQARDEWFVHTAPTRDNAMRAQAALEARGVDVEHPADATTAEAYLDAQRDGQLAEDPHRVIHETDLADVQDLEPRLHADVAVPETAATAEAPDRVELVASDIPAEVVVDLEGTPAETVVAAVPAVEHEETPTSETSVCEPEVVGDRAVPDIHDTREETSDETAAPIDTARAETAVPDTRELGEDPGAKQPAAADETDVAGDRAVPDVRELADDATAVDPEPERATPAVEQVPETGLPERDATAAGETPSETDTVARETTEPEREETPVDTAAPSDPVRVEDAAPDSHELEDQPRQPAAGGVEADVEVERAVPGIREPAAAETTVEDPERREADETSVPETSVPAASIETEAAVLATAVPEREETPSARSEADTVEELDQRRPSDADPSREVEDTEPVLETAVPDIRETSVADPTEAEDPDPRRRVADADETAEWVSKARDALTEIGDRNRADEVRDEHDAGERVAPRVVADHDELVRD